MRVKVCPKCGRENKESSATCFNCYADLCKAEIRETPDAASQGSDVTRQVTMAPPPPPPVRASRQQNRTAQIPPADTSATGTSSTAPSVPLDMPGDYRPSGYSHTNEAPPPKKKSAAPLAAFLIIVVVIGAVAAYMMKPQPEPKIPPDQVVSAFIEAKATEDIEKVKPYLDSMAIFEIEQSLRNAGKGKQGIVTARVLTSIIYTLPPEPKLINESDVEILKTEKNPKKPNQAIVLVRLTPKEMKLGLGPTECLIATIQERSEWKIDVAETKKIQNRELMEFLMPGSTKPANK